MFTKKRFYSRSIINIDGSNKEIQKLTTRELRAMHGADSVILSDIVRPDDQLLEKGGYYLSFSEWSTSIISAEKT